MTETMVRGEVRCDWGSGHAWQGCVEVAGKVSTLIGELERLGIDISRPFTSRIDLAGQVWIAEQDPAA